MSLVTMRRAAGATVLVALALGAGAAAAQDRAAMIKIAEGAGCMTCHQVETGARGPGGLAPIGPAWQDVGQKYRGQAGAADALTQTVMKGSNPYDSHW